MAAFNRVMGAKLALLVITLLQAVGGTVLLSAPYPEEGKLSKWQQPDGKELTLRMYGDEFYARTATQEGYTVVFDEASKAYYYAKMAPDGETLISSGVMASGALPQGTPKHLTESPRVIAEKRAKNAATLQQERNSDWSRRKRAVREQRGQSSETQTRGEKAPANSSAPSPAR